MDSKVATQANQPATVASNRYHFWLMPCLLCIYFKFC